VKSGPQKHREVGAVVHDEERRGAPAESGDLLGLGEDIAVPEALMAELEDLRAAFEQRGGGADRVEIPVFERRGVDDRIDAGKLQAQAILTVLD
jgi:hypothetical protein